MTFEEYIKNPMGQGSSVVTNRQLYKDLYTKKLDEIKVRENGLIKYTLYKSDDSYYIHFKIPSEVVPKFYYDTIIRLYNSNKGLIPGSLSNYDVQFYSNDPSFVYTFAHAFKKNDMFIKDLEYKMSTTALKEKPVQKNPKDELGYVKSLYFAYLEIKNNNLFSKSVWTNASSYNKKVWDNTVDHAEDKIRDRQELGKAIEKREKREANHEKESSKTKNSNHTFTSPNEKNFGHFKKEALNIIGKAQNNIHKSFGKFKKK